MTYKKKYYCKCNKYKNKKALYLIIYKWYVFNKNLKLFAKRVLNIYKVYENNLQLNKTT